MTPSKADLDLTQQWRVEDHETGVLSSDNKMGLMVQHDLNQTLIFIAQTSQACSEFLGNAESKKETVTLSNEYDSHRMPFYFTCLDKFLLLGPIHDTDSATLKTMLTQGQTLTLADTFRFNANGFEQAIAQAYDSSLLEEKKRQEAQAAMLQAEKEQREEEEQHRERLAELPGWIVNQNAVPYTHNGKWNHYIYYFDRDGIVFTNTFTECYFGEETRVAIVSEQRINVTAYCLLPKR